MPVMKIIKVALAVLLLLCFLDMPYGYYQFVRFLGMVTFAYLALQASQDEEGDIMWIYIALALLFQPFFKVSLGRSIWNVVDFVVAVWLLYSEFNSSEKNGK